MSVPVRNTAAANYEYAADADFDVSGLNHTLSQEEQYHIFQQQQQQLQQQEELYYQQQQQYQYQLNNNNNSSNDFYTAQVLRQQQFMQQRSSLSSSLSTSSPYQFANMPMDQQHNMSSSSEVKQHQEHHQMAENTMANGNGDQMTMNGSENVGDEWEMSDGGRYGTPGAAGLEYQKFSDLQQQQQQLASTGINDQAMLEPSLMDNEKTKNSNDDAKSKTNAAANLRNLEEELNALTSDDLFNTLKEYDALQDKYHTVLLLPKESRVSFNISQFLL